MSLLTRLRDLSDSNYDIFPVTIENRELKALLDVVEAAQDALDDCDRMFRTTTRLQEALQALEREQ